MISLHWHSPSLLWLLLLLPVVALGQRRALRRQPRLPFSSLTALEREPVGFWARLRGVYRYGYVVVWGLVALALAGPQRVVDRWPVWDKGVDVMFVLDLSESMKARDLPPSRIKSAQRLLLQLLQTKRQRNDRFGLVIFANRAYTLCPLTVDHTMLQEMLRDTRAGQIGDKTAMGDALATALARLRHHPTRKRAIVLITDGETNAGRLHPIRAAMRARTMKIPIHALLIGRNPEDTTARRPSPRAAPLQEGVPLTLASTPWGALQQVARISQGKAYRVTKAAALQRQFQQLLKTMLPTRLARPRMLAVYQDLYSWFVFAALGLLGGLVLLEITRLRSVP